MKYSAAIPALMIAGVLIAPTLPAATAETPSGFPFTDEDLNYSVNWPSGLNLGEAHLHARRGGTNWNFSFTLDASIPGFAVSDSYRSIAVPDFCSTSFERTTTHGSRKINERETIDRDRSLATRITVGKEGGKSEFPVPMCVRDALTFLFYARRELGQGRVPSVQQILMGGLIEMRMSYAAAPIITVAGKQVQSDQVTCTVKTSTSTYTFDTWYARDPARTLLLVSLPLSMGKFSMELTR
jgi:Protein of unknown function (DUF3108)